MNAHIDLSRPLAEKKRLVAYVSMLCTFLAAREFSASAVFRPLKCCHFSTVIWLWAFLLKDSRSHAQLSHQHEKCQVEREKFCNRPSKWSCLKSAITDAKSRQESYNQVNIGLFTVQDIQRSWMCQRICVYQRKRRIKTALEMHTGPVFSTRRNKKGIMGRIISITLAGVIWQQNETKSNTGKKNRVYKTIYLYKI